MKRIFSGILALLLSAASGATTLNPIQLLNPAGSASGQALVSTGASTPPVWGGVGMNGITSIGANTVLANATGSSASPTAFAMPSCSTSSSILQYTSGTGFTCSTTIWASPPAIGGTTAAAGKFTTLQATSTITPSSTAGIVGTTTNDSANSGSVGEYQTATTNTTSMTSATAMNATSVSLTAGDWDVQCNGSFNPAGSTTMSQLALGINTTSASLSALGALTLSQTTFTTGTQQLLVTPTVRESLASTTTVYCVAQSIFGTSTMTISALIRARRVR